VIRGQIFARCNEFGLIAARNASRRPHAQNRLIKQINHGAVLDFARNDRRGIRDIRTNIDESFRSSPQDELAVASLRKFSPVVFRPAVAGLLECALPARPCAGVLASLLGGEGR
jgi:hypothetical protein